jgi:hypothetical protein
MSNGRRKKKVAARISPARKPVKRHDMQPWVAATVLVGVRNRLQVARSAATTVIDELDLQIKSVEWVIAHCRALWRNRSSKGGAS